MEELKDLYQWIEQNLNQSNPFRGEDQYDAFKTIGYKNAIMDVQLQILKRLNASTNN